MRGEGRGCRSSSISGMNHCIHVTGVHGSSLSLFAVLGHYVRVHYAVTAGSCSG